jgi:hypothetical protein
MHTNETALRSHDSHSMLPDLDHDWFEDLVVPDLTWIVSTPSKYTSFLDKVPDIFAWQESSNHFANLQVLARSVALRRFLSCLDHIGRYDRSLCKAMRAAFEGLPLSGKLRFMTAPEAFCRISRLRKDPVESINFLCNALNGEAAFHGLGPLKKDCLTALGDFYCLEAAQEATGAMSDGKEDSSALQACYAPRLAEAIPIDFDSPNALIAQGSDKLVEHLPYSTEEKSLVCEKLAAAFDRIKSANPSAAQLIGEHVKVIVPLKTADSSSGSTSQPHVPGRVLLHGVERTRVGALASALVHEAMHQVLYILEWSGNFVISHPDERTARATSGWTGRDLKLHSYIHACFIWYGLSNFWALARSSEAFEPGEVQRELARSLAGFRDRNPIDLLTPHGGLVRYDVVKVAGTLRGRLQGLIDPMAA